MLVVFRLPPTSFSLHFTFLGRAKFYLLSIVFSFSEIASIEENSKSPKLHAVFMPFRLLLEDSLVSKSMPRNPAIISHRRPPDRQSNLGPSEKGGGGGNAADACERER